MPSTIGLYSGTAAPQVAGNDTTSLYGGAAVPVPSATGNTTVRGNLLVTGDATIQGELTVGDDVCIEGDTLTLRCDSASPGDAYIIVDRDGLTPDASITWDEASDVWVYNFALEAPTVTGGNVVIAPNTSPNLNLITTQAGHDLQLDSDSGQITFLSNDIQVPSNTTISWNENNTAANRLKLQSTTGTASGVHLIPPPTYTPGSGVTRLLSFNSPDLANTDYLGFRVSETGENFRIISGTVTGGVDGPSGKKINFYDFATQIASVNPAGPTDPLDLVTVQYLTAGSFVFNVVNIDNRVFLDSGELTTSAVTPNQTLDSFVAATYASAKYQIQIKSGASVHVMEVFVMHDGTTAFQTTYADMYSGASLTTIATTVSGGNVLLQVTPTNAVTTYKFSRTLVTA